MSNKNWLFKWIVSIKWTFWASVILISIELVVGLGYIWIQKFIIDNMFTNNEYNNLHVYIVIYIILIILFNLLFLFNAYHRKKNELLIQRNLVSEIFECLVKIPHDFLQKKRTGQLVQNLTEDVQQISVVISKEIPQGIQEILAVIIFGIFLWSASPIILLFIIIVSILYIFIGNYFGPKIKKTAKETQEMKSDLLVHVEECISLTREIISYNRQEWEMRRYTHIFNSYFSKLMKGNFLENKQILITEPLRWSINLVILGYGAYLVILGELSLGTFVVIIHFSTDMMDAIIRVYTFIVGLNKSYANIERIREVLESSKLCEGNLSIPHSIDSLCFSNVSFHYPDQEKLILKDISIDLPIGKKIAFVGMSGSGKSTLVSLLMKIREPSIGKIYVNNLPLEHISREEWMSRIGVVFQEPYFFSDTVISNLTLGKQVRGDLVHNILKEVGVEEFVERLPKGYQTYIGDRGITLSGGQKQRLALARAILLDREILILDEATSALDLETERKVQKYIDKLRKNKTTIIIAHRLATVLNSDIIFVMDKGKIVESGTHEELMDKNSFYKDLIRKKLEVSV